MAMIQNTDNLPIKIAALYCFAPLSKPEECAAHMRSFCGARGMAGTLIFAREGVNGTIAGSDTAIDAAIAELHALGDFSRMELKFSRSLELPFYRLKVKTKAEIVTMGVPDLDPLAGVGTYVDPQDWNDLISEPNTITIDTRNDYETAIGTFEHAVDPATDNFRSFPEWAEKNRERLEGKKIAMFCTGGIRCEKSTAYMKSIGFKDVFHLKGGILKYLENVPEAESKWQGECFVFDERVSVKHGLAQGEAALCRGCRHPLMPEDLRSPEFVHGVSCPHCAKEKGEEARARYAERQRQLEIAKKRGKPVPIGQDMAAVRAEARKQKEAAKDALRAADDNSG